MDCKCPLGQGYGSPRISSEFPDCSLPLTFDQYSCCSYGCLYCFAYYQRVTNPSCKDTFTEKKPRSVNPQSVIKFLRGESKSRLHKHMYDKFIAKGHPFHWGGLSDPFCNFEKEYGVGYEILKVLDELKIPTIFSTKGTLCAEGKYLELFKRNPSNWIFQFSIITANEENAKIVEAGVPTPNERLKAMKTLSDIGCKTILRLRPYIIGFSSLDAKELITKAHEAGAISVSTEFFCLDTRANEVLLDRYKTISKVIGFDIYNYYKKLSTGSGYLRLNPKVKEKYALEMYRTAKSLGMEIMFSGPDFKELSDSTCCCGIPEGTPNFDKFSRGHFCEAIRMARKNGSVSWSDISDKMEWMSMLLPDTGVSFISEHLATKSKSKCPVREFMTVQQYIRNLWNNPNRANSPYKYFHGKLYPWKKDDNGNIIYKYKKAKWEGDLDV